ncbi:MAG: class I SAM-dependent methyltransferase [Methylocystaceae bacterium]|nr:class I SAM-dependent methyltransferase [Methylocystaceae bacterium]
MSGFSPEWLALREMADHRARSSDLTGKLSADFATRDLVRVMDLGCGTGSNLRALAPHLGIKQDWILVDENTDLLSHAQHVLRDWADYAEGGSKGLTLYHGEQIIRVYFLSHDLSAGLEPLLSDPCDLITASALCDLVSADWIKGLASTLAVRQIPFFTVLTYDGRIQWFPPHSQDQAVLEAFNTHQKGNKGFGSASGPEATELLVRAFSDEGYLCETADSAWIINRSDEAALMQALGEGIADAASQINIGQNLSNWREALAERRSVLIGHLDFYGRPVTR